MLGMDAGGDRVLLQPQGIRRLRLSPLPKAQDGHLLEPLELPIGKAPDRESLKIVHQDTADVRGKAVIGDHIDQQAPIG